VVCAAHVCAGWDDCPVPRWPAHACPLGWRVDRAVWEEPPHPLPLWRRRSAPLWSAGSLWSPPWGKGAALCLAVSQPDRVRPHGIAWSISQAGALSRPPILAHLGQYFIRSTGVLGAPSGFQKPKPPLTYKSIPKTDKYYWKFIFPNHWN